MLCNITCRSAIIVYSSTSSLHKRPSRATDHHRARDRKNDKMYQVSSPGSLLLGRDGGIEHELRPSWYEPKFTELDKAELTGNNTQIKNVVKLPRNAIRRSNSGKRIATPTHAAVTPIRAISRPTVFRLAARAASWPSEASGAGANAPVVGIVKELLPPMA
jgi:hypothetical protein